MTNPDEARLIADLNDLIKLDRDALEGYTIAIEAMENDGFRETLRLFRADHERHVAELTSLVRAAGGAPSESSHAASSVFKSALQQIGALAGDRGILFAFEANERQVRDKYWHYADSPMPPAVRSVVRRAAGDEDRHYSWAAETLKRSSATEPRLPGPVQELLAQLHGRVGDAMEAVERRVEEEVIRRRDST